MKGSLKKEEQDLQLKKRARKAKGKELSDIIAQCEQIN